MLSRPIPIDAELERLLALARKLPPMTSAQIDAQRRSWVIGEMMLEHPDMTREDVIAIMDQTTERSGFSDLPPLKG